MLELRSLILDALTLCVAIIAIWFGGRHWLGARGDRLQPPQQENIQVDEWETIAADGHRVGRSDAPLTIVTWEDFQCPGCRSLAPRLRRFREKYPDDVALVYRHWPLPMHSQAYNAARAAECAGDQGRFREFRLMLYESAEWMTNRDVAFESMATAINMPDIVAFKKCFTNAEPVPGIEHDIATVEALQARGTPTVIVNGLMLSSPPSSEDLEELLQAVGAIAR